MFGSISRDHCYGDDLSASGGFFENEPNDTHAFNMIVAVHFKGKQKLKEIPYMDKYANESFCNEKTLFFKFFTNIRRKVWLFC